MLAAVVGAASLIPMVALAAQSALVQLTATSPRAELHATAVAVIGMAFLAVVGVWVFTTLAPPVRPGDPPQRLPEGEGARATFLAGT